jgi:hypothetical protein
MRLGFKRSLIVGVAVVLALAVLAPVAMAYPVHVWGECHGVFYGGIRDLSGASVTVDNPADPGHPFASTTSGSDGMFGVWADLVAPSYSGTCDVSATMSGFSDAHLMGVSFADNMIDPGAAGATDAINLQLVVLKTTVKGKVVSKASGKPLGGVKVTLGKTTVKTNKAGKFSVAAGLWPTTTNNKITFSKKGFHNVTKIVPAKPNGTITFAKAIKLSK